MSWARSSKVCNWGSASLATAARAVAMSCSETRSCCCFFFLKRKKKGHRGEGEGGKVSFITAFQTTEVKLVPFSSSFVSNVLY